MNTNDEQAPYGTEQREPTPSPDQMRAEMQVMLGDIAQRIPGAEPIATALDAMNAVLVVVTKELGELKAKITSGELMVSRVETLLSSPTCPCGTRVHYQLRFGVPKDCPNCGKPLPA